MPLFALVDCNNFYVSCERVFNPKLENKAVVVLSNNDGCVVARSNESKLLGVKMGEPYFMVRRRFPANSIIALSSNYALYADLSNRVMNLLTEACPEIEYYSIDESFLLLDAYQKLDLTRYLTQLRAKIKQHVGIPVSIGVARTKVLAKVANNLAKKHTSTGVLFLLDSTKINSTLEHYPVGEIWGIGPAWSKQLHEIGITTASDLKKTNPNLMQHRFNVMLARIIYELNEIDCFNLEEAAPRKSIVCSRSFAKLTNDKTIIAQALSSYCEIACQKLREQNSLAGKISVFLRTNPHKAEQQYCVNLQSTLPHPTADTRIIIKIALQCLEHSFKSQYYYQKVGVMLFNLTSQKQIRLDFDAIAKQDNMMTTLDEINQRYGSRTLFLASSGAQSTIKQNRQHVSPRYTTCWDDLLHIG